MPDITPHMLEMAVVKFMLFGAVAFCVLAIVANWRSEDMACKKGKKKGKK